MATIHNAANLGDIAKVVLMSGDPLRAKYIAQTYLKDVVQFNDIRNMLGYSGYYKGVRISVMGSGMGCGSMGLYSHELFHKYDVDVIIRVGSCGAYSTKLRILDVFLAESSYSESTYAKTYSDEDIHMVESDKTLNETIKGIAAQKDIVLVSGRLHTSDCFYHKVKENLEDLVDNKQCLCVDMESFALFHNAKEANKKATTILTVSDHSITKENVSSEERETSFQGMIELALQSAIACKK